MENYYEAKKKLFTEHCRTAIVNIDDTYGKRLYDELKDCGCERISYGLHENANVHADNYLVLSIYNKINTYSSIADKSMV